MKYRKLGNTDIDVSVICLGTMTFGEQNTQQDGFDQMDYALERGVNFFDTAELYAVMPRKETYGKTEEIIGNWLREKKNRNKIILASKIASKTENDLSWIRGGAEKLGFDKKNMNAAIDASLRRLKTDYIDLYQLHWPERKVPKFGKLDFEYDPYDNDWTQIEEVLEKLNDVLQERLFPKGNICPNCSAELTLKNSPRFGPFIGCTKFDESGCDYKSPPFLTLEEVDAHAKAKESIGFPVLSVISTRIQNPYICIKTISYYCVFGARRAPRFLWETK